ncbi:AER236Cp [Eremothecium gossypii ATCC 10895]|uniref:AER236Cp n=1 Tax=Eremothecium gossypii (strain ATCC 10895 / CBS 109.51 / FGSC 9923 / NRRL Y-1056) TaxID=284811 RepID=Q756L8_EREGS|nr:AER236Cp [Eremothecium gossypii ATCC 10895]AAS52917.2 AER236Cp [Eremothecium gossypii ATCC 10895]AEY97225.1 FAER236Cp [Eremothecium gossypii FDAG1]
MSKSTASKPRKGRTSTGSNPKNSAAAAKKGKPSSSKKQRDAATTGTEAPAESQQTVEAQPAALELRITQAVQELTKYVSSKTTPESVLIDDSELTGQLQLIATSVRAYSKPGNLKPTLLAVKHSLFKPWKKASATAVKDFKVLLIMRDQDMDKVSDDALYESIEQAHGICIDKVISGHDLKTTYKAFEKRRALLSEFSLVLADDAIVSALPKLLGSKAYEKIQTTPVPIRTGKAGVFSMTTLANSVRRIFNERLPVLLPSGVTLNVHIGHLDWFTPEELTANVASLASQLIAAHPIRSLYLKSNNSPALPLYYSPAALQDATAAAAAAHVAGSSGTVSIDGVDLPLSSFDRALAQIANPDELPVVFAKQIARAKRSQENLPELGSANKRSKQ